MQPGEWRRRRSAAYFRLASSGGIAGHARRRSQSVVMSRVPFAHASEAELARLFNFYRIPWEYEPRSFPIAWNEQGRPIEFFTPDFYLPEYDLYIEVTVAKPIRNTRKNRKLRLMRSHHPLVNVKLFTRRDVERVFSRLKRAS
jgi:hypoxanthine phosphoribosyltransferase